MRQIGVKKCIILGIVFFVLQAGSLSVVAVYLKNNVLSVLTNDQLDQSQTQWEGAGCGTKNYCEQAQSFKPTLNVLTRIELIVTHQNNENPTGIVKMSIRDSITGDDLTSFTIDAATVPYSYPSEIVWVEFDFPDITVVPEQTYYMYVIIDLNSTGNDSVYWGMHNPDPYPRGQRYWYQNPYPEDDFCFQTYGTISNTPPGKPDINGPTTVIVGKETSYTFIAIDPEDDNIYYEIDWGDGTTDSWFGPFVSNVVIQKSHTWNYKGPALIKARAKDIHGAIGNWEEMSITVPYSYNLPFMQCWIRLCERFPNSFSVLRHILGY